VPLKEKLLIQRIRQRAARSGSSAVAGIGDDCAVLRLARGHQTLVTTDFSLEGVHFRREWHPPDSVGHRCLTRGLSDIAAMGGIPHAAFLSLALPPDLPQRWVDGFLAGFLKLADSFSVLLAGGDTAQSPSGILADIVVLGSVPAGKAVLRSGAKPGDLLYVTGTLGSADAALHRLFAGQKLRPRSHPKHFYPQPRLAVGQLLRQKNLASAMIDISDGLSTDLAHLCDESGVGAVVYGEKLPIPSSMLNILAASHGTHVEPAFRLASKRVSSSDLVSQAAEKVARPRGSGRAGLQARVPALHFYDSEPASAGGTKPLSGPFSQSAPLWQDFRLIENDALALALHGGDEYELLFTAPPNRRIPKEIADVPIARIGEIVRGKHVRLATPDGRTQTLKPAGWEHFA
jgi:thiamine-monophosphate kinase